MDHPFSKSVSLVEKCKRLQEVVSPEDTLAILINADPDSMAAALALKQFFWRRIKKASIYHINTIKRADNLALMKLLKLDQKHIRHLKGSDISKWAIIDSQPHHDEQFGKFRFDIIIDHHPPGQCAGAPFIDIRED